MKICMVTSSFPRYKGDYAGQHVYNQAVGLSDRHEIHVIYPTDRTNSEPCELFYHHPFRYPFKTYPMAQVRGLDLMNTFVLFRRMGSVIRKVKREHGIDLFYAFWTIPSAFVCSFACGYTPFITGLMGSDDKVFGRRGITHPFSAYAIRKSARIISLSQELRRQAIEMKARDDAISIIPSGVDINRYAPGDKKTLKAELGLTDSPTLLYVGSLFKLKRIDWLIRISAGLAENYCFESVIIGDGPERERLEALAIQMNADNVHFLGRKPYEDVPKYMAAADLLVLFSETEGLPSCIQEAMSTGTPVMATAVGGVPDIVSNGVNGYIVNSEEQIHHYLTLLLESPQLLAQMGENARRYALEYLSSDKIFGQICSVCEAAVNAGNHPSTTSKVIGGPRPCIEKKPDIGLMSTFRPDFLSSVIDVQLPSVSQIHVVAPTLNRQDVKFHSIAYEIGGNVLSQIVNQVISQLRMAYQVIRLRNKVDFWIFLGCDVFLLPILAARILGLPALLSLMGNLEQETFLKKNALNPVQRLMRKINFTIANRMVVLSEGLISKWNLNQYRSKILVAQSQFIDLNNFAAKKPLSSRDRLVGYIGRLSQEKGVWNMVHSMPLVMEKDSDVKFRMIGYGPLYEHISEYIQSSNMDGKVTLSGRIPYQDVPESMNELRLIVLPSYTEGLPGTVIEAMACGTPVLATPVGAVDDIVTNGKTGFLLENNSTEEIANGILKAINERDLEMIANRARKLVEDEFSLSAAQRNYRKVIQEGSLLRNVSGRHPITAVK